MQKTDKFINRQKDFQLVRILTLESESVNKMLKYWKHYNKAKSFLRKDFLKNVIRKAFWKTS